MFINIFALHEFYTNNEKSLSHQSREHTTLRMASFLPPLQILLGPMLVIISFPKSWNKGVRLEVSSVPGEPIREVRARIKRKMLDRLLILCAGNKFM